MKIATGSDLHLEFQSLNISNKENADVLILAGDIMVSSLLYTKDETSILIDSGREFKVKKSNEFHTFFQKCCQEFKNVIYVLGNHEYYNGKYPDSINSIKENLSYLPNLHILEKESIKINNILFVCGTMWTNFNNNDPLEMLKIARYMTDFKRIVVDNGIFSPYDAYKDHNIFMNFVKEELAKPEHDKVVIVTHHCPSMKCVPLEYSEDNRVNHGYISNYDCFILQNPKITHWICGHSHNKLDTMIGNTNIIMNCRGYFPQEKIAHDFDLKYIEV